VQSPSWEANWFAASQEIPRISRNPKVHYRTHKRPPPVPILHQPNPVHIPTSHLLEIRPNINHPSTPRSPQWSLSLLFPYQDSIHPLSSPIRATCPAHLILLDFITRTILVGTQAFWNTKEHKRSLVFQNACLPTVPILSQINPLRALQTYFFEVCFKINIPSTFKSTKRSLSLKVSAPTSSMYLSSMSHAPRALHISLICNSSPKLHPI